MAPDVVRVVNRRVMTPLVSLAGLALPLTCGGCGVPGPRWCAECLHELALACCGPVDEVGVPVFATARYAGVVRNGVRAFKDGGRRDLLDELAPLMASALIRAVSAAPEASWVVPAPSSAASRRARGDVPAHLLIRSALRGASALTGREMVWAPILRHRRRVADQVGLGRRERGRNLHEALSVVEGIEGLAGRSVVVADDVVTTGSTVRECIRAVREVGAVPVSVAALALTPGPDDVSKRVARLPRTLA